MTSGFLASQLHQTVRDILETTARIQYGIYGRGVIVVEMDAPGASTFKSAAYLPTFELENLARMLGPQKVPPNLANTVAQYYPLSTYVCMVIETAPSNLVWLEEIPFIKNG